MVRSDSLSLVQLKRGTSAETPNPFEVEADGPAYASERKGAFQGRLDWVRKGHGHPLPDRLVGSRLPHVA